MKKNKHSLSGEIKYKKDRIKKRLRGSSYHYSWARWGKRTTEEKNNKLFKFHCEDERKRRNKSHKIC